MIRILSVLAFVMSIAACGGSTALLDDVANSLGELSGTACLRPIHATGVMVGPGQMLTAAHVIAGADDDLHVVGLDGAEHSVRVLAFDDQRDLALLNVDDLDAPPLALGQPVAGDEGVITSISRDLELRVIDYRIVQVVIARSGDIYDEGEVLRTALELDATIEPGDSGAPLIDNSGLMVGTVFARSTGTGAGEAWALHPDEITAFLSSVTDVGEVDRGRCR